MTITEKIKMHKGKKTFIDNISRAFEAKPAGSTVETISYELYHKIIARDENTYHHYVEFIVVTFIGGGKSVKVVNGNSNTANFRALGTLLDGGYCEENSYYESMLETGYELINLSNRLDELLSKPMKHISDVRACFNYCKDGNDVEKVIKMIPSVFSTFDVEYNEDDETFLIINEYEENGDWQTEEVEYEFYTED